MSVNEKQKKTFPPLRSRVRKMGDTKLPNMKGQLSARPADSFKSKKIRDEDVTLLLKFLQESFDLEPSTTPADTVCKLRLKMSNTDNKIKWMKEQLKDHDVLLLDVQEELDLGPEVNAIRTARAFKTYIRTSKERTAYLEKTIKGNEALLKTCKDIAGVSGHHAPDGLANYFSSTWSRQRHVISKLHNKIQELKENGHTLSKEDSNVNLKDSILDLAGAMDVDTSNSNISTIVTEMKDTFTSMKNDVINLNDMVKVKKEEIKNVQDLEKTNSNRIVELENEMDDFKKRNNYLTLDLEQSQEKLKSATNLVSDLEHKIRDLQIGNDKKALEIEGLLQCYEEAGEIVSNLQTELDDTKQLNQFLNLQIKALDTAKVDDVADWEQQKKELESQLESLRTAEFQANAQVLSLKLELGEMKVQKDDALVELKKLQVNAPKKDNHILELEKEIAILQKEKLELETKLETLKSKDSKTDPPKPESRDHKTTEFSWKSGYDFTTPKAYDRTESKGGSLVLTLERKISDLEQEKKDLTSQLKNHHGNDGDNNNNNVLVDRKVVELLRQKSELGQQLKSLNQEKEELISQHKTDINRIKKEKENLAKLLKGLIDQRHESISLIQKCADEYEASDLLLRRTTERLQSSLREKSVLLEENLRHDSKVSHLKSELKHLKSKLKDEKEKHQRMTKNTLRQEKITSPSVATKLDNGKITALTQEIEKLKEKIADLKTKIADISKELEQSHQDRQKAEEKFAKASQQRQEFKNRLDIINEEKGKLFSQLEDIKKENKELNHQLFTLNEEKIELQSSADCMEEEKSDLSTQLSEARKQYQDLEEGFAAVYAEKKQLQVLTVSLEDERDRLSDQINENHKEHQDREHSFSDEGQDLEWDQEIDLGQEPIHGFTEDDNQELEWDQEIPVQKPKPCFTEEKQDLEWDQEIESVQSKSYQSPSSSFEIERHGSKLELRKSPQQCQVLDQTFKRKKTIKKQSSSQTENGDGLSAKLQEANNKYHELEQECDLLLGEKLEFQALADSLAEDNYKLSSQIGHEYEERHNLEDKLNSLEEEVEKQKFSSKLKEENSTLSTSLESVQNLCKELEQKVAAAAQDKAEFERESFKWKKERNNLLEQLQNQKQDQKSDARRNVALKASAIIDQEIAKVLDKEIAQLQIRKERVKLETAERDRLELMEQNKVAMEKVKETEKLRMDIEEKNKKLQNEIMLVKNEVDAAYSKIEGYKSDITDLNIQKKSLHEQIKMQKKNYQGLEEKASTMIEMIDLMEKKVFRAENRQKEVEEEIQSMKASVTSAAIQHGLLESVEDSICLTDLFEALDGMKQLNAHMKREIADLKKTKQTYVEMISLTGNRDPFLDCGDSAVEISPGERERYQLKEMIDDLGFQICKQESMIKKLRYQLSVFHKNVLHEKDSMYDNMTYIDRAVVESIHTDIEIPTIKSEDLSFLVGADIDEDDDLIGKGSFGEVFLREYQGEAVAVKVPYISEGVRDEDDQKRMVRIKADYARTTMEALVNIAFADHPSFPKTVGVVDIKGAPSLILEFLGDKKTGTSFSLSQAIRFQIPSVSKENWFTIIMDIISGMKAMHEEGLLHNDLKANNILLQWDLEDQRWHAFIIDMGKVSTQTIPPKHKRLPKEEVEGYKQGILFPHLAPEYILDLQPMSVQTDIYSLGVLLVRIDKVLRSRPLRDLATQMTNVNPRLRPSWKLIEKVITRAQKRNYS